MATNAENLKTRRTAIITALAGLTPYSGDDLPNTSGPGVHADLTGYRQSLLDELKQIEQALAMIEGPYDNFSCVQV